MHQTKIARATLACCLIAFCLLGSPGLHALKYMLLQGASSSEGPSVVCCDCHGLPTSPSTESTASLVADFDRSHLPCSIGKFFAKKFLANSITQPVLSFLVVPCDQVTICRLLERCRSSYLARGPPHFYPSI